MITVNRLPLILFFVFTIAIYECKGNKRDLGSLHQATTAPVQATKTSGKSSKTAAIKPYYTVRYSSHNCNFLICINDVPVFTHTDGGAINSEVPINHLILHSGSQKIRYVLLPLNGQTSLNIKSSLDIKIIKSDADDISNSTDVATFKTLVVTQPKQSQLQEIQQFNAAVPYQVEGWQHGADLQGIPSVHSELLHAYQDILRVIKAKNFTQLKKYFAIKVKEADIATYSDDSSTAEDWKEFTDYLSKPGAHYTLDTANSKLYVFGDGKLVTLLTPNRQSALRIYDPKDKSEYLLPLYFYRKSAGQPLTLIR